MKQYRHVAVASTFSPTHRAVMAEAMHFARRMGAKIVVLHAAPRTDEKATAFAETFSALGEEADVLWAEREGDPAEILLGAVRDGGYELLVAGALERDAQREEKAFAGSVARRLLSESPCDLLLLPRPQEKEIRLTGLFFAAETGQAVADFLAGAVSKMDPCCLTFAVTESPFAAAIASSRGEEAVDPQRWAEEICDKLDAPELEVEIRVVGSNTGFGLWEVAQSSGRDLMLVRARRDDGRIIFPGHLDWLRQVIPMRLLISVEDQ